MSSTSLVVFNNGVAARWIEYQNSWGGAARIWSSLFDAYIPKRHEYDSWMASGGADLLWPLASQASISLPERAVLAFTFDRFYVRRKNFARLAADLRAFVERFPVVQKVDHLPAWAKWLDDPGDAEAVALYASSCGEDLWERPKTCPHCKQDTDEYEPVPLTEGCEVYDWIAENKKG